MKASSCGRHSNAINFTSVLGNYWKLPVAESLGKPTLKTLEFLESPPRRFALDAVR